MFENGELDPRPAQLPERLRLPTVEDIVPGSVHWIDYAALWAEKDSGELWVNNGAPLVYYDDDFVARQVRIIAFDEGLVVDLTSILDDEGNIRRFYPSSFAQHVDDENFSIGDYQRTVGIVSTKKELAALKDIFKDRYGMRFNGKPTKDKAKTPAKKKQKTPKPKVK